jgi:3'(2'), 5'-bisphosphate nucleotidase
MDDASLLALAFELAASAGRLILDIRAQGFETQMKADASPVTRADREAERLITAGLRVATPELPVVAEEAVAAGATAMPAGAFWCVDPLDGTKEFTAGRDDFAVCIGLVREGRAVLGVVAAPAQNTAWGGIVGRGAGKRQGDGPVVPITARQSPARGLTVVASRHHGKDPRMAPFLASRSVAEVRNIGSALKFCLLAEGLADLYPRFGPTMEWDTCAAQAVLEAAGGSVRTLADDAVLRYGKPGWLNPHFYAAGRS